MLGGKLGAAEPGCYFSFRTPLCYRGLPLRCDRSVASRLYQVFPTLNSFRLRTAPIRRPCPVFLAICFTSVSEGPQDLQSLSLGSRRSRPKS
jgi:hypothetical protein